MIKNILFVAFALLYLCSFAQKTDGDYNPASYKTSTCKSSFPKIKLEGEVTVASIQGYLKSNMENLKDEKVGLKLNYVNESPGGFHYSFHQTFNGIEVYQSEVKVNLDNRNVIRSVFDNSENTSGWNFNAVDATENSVIAIHPETNVAVLAERKTENQFYELLEAGGEVIFRHDRRAFATQDSLVSGKIFNPDPLTTANVVYDPPYTDNNDASYALLDAQVQTVNFRTKFDTSQALFSLESPYVRVKDFDSPSISPATSATAEFYFDRSQSGFEDVNAFYHISVIQNHIHSLGFNCADGLVDVDVHANSGADNSYFYPGLIPNRIYYGDGGVDDAEDADVVVHEYGHAVSETASPNSNVDSQRQSLDEGFGDYLAATYSKSINTYNDTWTFNWDGHNEFWNGRVTNTTRIYPADLMTGIYRNGEMWVAALMDLSAEIGRVATDSLILQTHYSYAQSISMRDAYYLMMDADTVLTNGKYSCPIYRHMLAHGFAVVDPSIQCTVGFEDIPELHVLFMSTGKSFTIVNQDAEKLRMEILDISGQKVLATDIHQARFDYQNEELPSGVYLVALQSNDAIKTFKWCKAQ